LLMKNIRARKGTSLIANFPTADCSTEFTEM
jgi:hypothetical protein